MPRHARQKSETGIYHIMLRGINRQNIFEDEEDIVKFLQTLSTYKDKSGFEIYAYCFMGNHIHLLIKEGKEDLGLAFKRIGASYVYWYNWKYKRCGHLFQDRFKSEAVKDDSYFLTVLRYIHQNPMKANIEPDIAQYKWSSYNEYIKGQKICDIDFALKMFGGDTDVSIERYKKFMFEENEDRCLDFSDTSVRLTDQEAREIIMQQCKISSTSDFQRLNANNRDMYIKVLLQSGISTRQLSRLTGISRVIILKA